MTDPITRERRPAQAPNPTNTTETSLPSAEADRTQARCDVCGHHLHKPSSVAARRGPVCAARVVDLDELEEVRREDRTV